MSKVAFFWFRRDLRLEDNHGLYQALLKSDYVIPIFIFDTNILEKLFSDDPRVTFIHDKLSELKARLNQMGSDLICLAGEPAKVWRSLIHKYKNVDIYCNQDYEPYATERDQEIQSLCVQNGSVMKSFKDHVIFESDEIRKADGGIYTVFTPYMKKWKFEYEKNRGLNSMITFPVENYYHKFKSMSASPMMSLSELGFESNRFSIPSSEADLGILRNYDKTRNFPGLAKGTSRLGIHLRFGTISIRKLANEAYQLNQTYFNELIWREFYSQILHSYPRLVNESFRPAYDRIEWNNDPGDFDRWCNGMTGYPLVDAGMRELNSSGYMHNRLRMITASFLTKHLLIDWRWGESYFAQKLLDFDLASNNGGWQWSAGCGTDAAPYFRIFNPKAQQAKFDAKQAYIRKWVPEFESISYPKEIIDHKFARERCLTTYKKALNFN